MTLLQTFERALTWIDEYSIVGGGIVDTHKARNSYPEVSGYFIPSLLQWGEREHAYSYGKWLLAAQQPDGSWLDASGKMGCMFDTGQVLRGLLALQALGFDTADAIPRACDWLCGKFRPNGSPEPPERVLWGAAIPDAIILYILEPLRRAAQVYGREEWSDAAERCLCFFAEQEETTRFTCLSHFHAYILEALYDLGRGDLAARGLKEVERLLHRDGTVPGERDAGWWVCSTGLFQYAVIWYKLGDQVKADRAFARAARLQNKSGGWYGSYARNWFFYLLRRLRLLKKPHYFRNAEISWAVKFFLDAFSLKLQSEFERQAPTFLDAIETDDGRYQLIRETIKREKSQTVLEAGCGKGRYLLNLAAELPSVRLQGMDIASAVMRKIPETIPTNVGTLLQMPFKDASFDLVYTAEALEHAVNIKGALREMLRVVRPGGIVIIIDKNSANLNRSRLKLEPWEQWFSLDGLKQELEDLGCEVTVAPNLCYEKKKKKDGLFAGWIARKPSL